MVSVYTVTTSDPGSIDRLDAALIELLAAEPRVGVLEASRRLRVARGTVQARLERMQERGVITGYGPEVDPAALGYEVTAFITLEIRQAGGHDPVAARLAAIPEVLEVHTITGAGDMLCRVVARDNADLQRVLDAIVATNGVVRSATVISLASPGPLPDPPPGPRRRPRPAGEQTRRVPGRPGSAGRTRPGKRERPVESVRNARFRDPQLLRSLSQLASADSHGLRPMPGDGISADGTEVVVVSRVHDVGVRTG